MIRVPNEDVLELLAVSDQQLFASICEGIGIDCHVRTIDSTQHEIDPMLIESMALHMSELDEYRINAIHIAESIGFHVSLNDDLAFEPVVIDEGLGSAIRGAMATGMQALATGGRALMRGLSWAWDNLGKPLLGIFAAALGTMLANASRSGRYAPQEVSTQEGPIFAENLYGFVRDYKSTYDKSNKILPKLETYLQNYYTSTGKTLNTALIPITDYTIKTRFEQSAELVKDQIATNVSPIKIPSSNIDDHYDYYLIAGVSEWLKHQSLRNSGPFKAVLSQIERRLADEIRNAYPPTP